MMEMAQWLSWFALIASGAILYYTYIIITYNWQIDQLNYIDSRLIAG